MHCVLVGHDPRLLSHCGARLLLLLDNPCGEQLVGIRKFTHATPRLPIPLPSFDTKGTQLSVAS
jgi:hypothetical protein